MCVLFGIHNDADSSQNPKALVYRRVQIGFEHAMIFARRVSSFRRRVHRYGDQILGHFQ